MFGEPLVWKVIKQYGRDWLCEIDSPGKYKGTKAKIPLVTIRLGVERFKLQERKNIASTCSVVVCPAGAGLRLVY
jgi:hypothetical protein